MERKTDNLASYKQVNNELNKEHGTKNGQFSKLQASYKQVNNELNNELNKELDELKVLFDDLDDKKRAVILPLLDEIAFMKEQLKQLRALPQIRIHPTNAARQEITPAGKQYKNIMQTYNAAVKTVLSELNKADTDDGDELLKQLAEFDKWTKRI